MPTSRSRKRVSSRRKIRRAPNGGETINLGGIKLRIESFVSTYRTQIMNSDYHFYRSKLPRPPIGEELEAVLAHEILEEHYRQVRASIEELANTMPSPQWLWYLRRCPKSMFSEGDSLASTTPYDQRLAEIVSGSSAMQYANQSFRGFRNSLNFPVDDWHVIQVLRLASRVMLLSDIERHLRRAAKGSRFKSTDRWLEPIPNVELEMAISNYDDRKIAEGGGLVVGTQVMKLGMEFEELDNSQMPVLVAMRSKEEVPFALPKLLQTTRRQEIISVGYIADFASMEPMLELIRSLPKAERSGWDEALPETIFMMHLLGKMVFLERPAALLLTLLDTGYVWRTKNGFDEMFNSISTVEGRREIDGAFGVTLPTDSEELIRRIAAINGNARPVSCGPLIRVIGDSFFFDVLLATSRIATSLTGLIKENSSFANGRGQLFELLTRDAIATSGATPDPAINNYVGREIRFEGNPITDLDAIAAVDGMTLLISCKSIAHTPEIDAGMYAPVRNASDLLKGAIVKWQEILAFLESNPIGDNYDFSGQVLRGVIVTPSVIWAGSGMPFETAIDRSDGRRLAWVSSIDELRRFLAEEQSL